MANGPACLTARAQLAQGVADLRKSSLTEQGVGLIKTGFLSPKTILKKTVGDVALAGVENLITKPLAVGYDYLASVARSAATFGAKSPAEFRELGNALTPSGAKYGALGFREGLAKSIALLRTGVDVDHVGDQFNLERTTYQNPILKAVTNGVYNALHATVKPWYGLALNMDLYARASINATREGLSGAAKTARINELLANPTDEMALGAVQSAEYATLMNKTALGEAASGIKSRFKQASEDPKNSLAKRTSAQAAYVGSELVMPFTGVPSAVGGVLVDYSPFGAAKTLAMMAKAAKGDVASEAGLQGKVALAGARATVGTGLIGLGYVLARKGLLTGSYPTNPAEKALWQAEGKQPYSFQHDGQWHSLTGMAPLGLAPLVGADVAQYTTHQEQHGDPVSATDQAVQGGVAMTHTLTQQSFLQGIATLTDALTDPERSAAREGAQFLTAPIPTVAKQIIHGLDPVTRQQGGFVDQIKGNVPGLEQTLPPKLDQFGTPLTRGPGGLTGVAREMLDITNTRPSTSNPATDEMERLGLGLPSFGRSISLPGQPKGSLSTSDYNAKVQEFGPMKRAMIESVIKTPGYQQLPDDEKKAALENILRSITSSGNAITKARKLGASIPPASQYLGGTP